MAEMPSTVNITIDTDGLAETLADIEGVQEDLAALTYQVKAISKELGLAPDGLGETLAMAMGAKQKPGALQMLHKGQEDMASLIWAQFDELKGALQETIMVKLLGGEAIYPDQAREANQRLANVNTNLMALREDMRGLISSQATDLAEDGPMASLLSQQYKAIEQQYVSILSALTILLEQAQGTPKRWTDGQQPASHFVQGQLLTVENLEQSQDSYRIEQTWKMMGELSDLLRGMADTPLEEDDLYLALHEVWGKARGDHELLERRLNDCQGMLNAVLNTLATGEAFSSSQATLQASRYQTEKDTLGRLESKLDSLTSATAARAVAQQKLDSSLEDIRQRLTNVLTNQMALEARMRAHEKRLQDLWLQMDALKPEA